MSETSSVCQMKTTYASRAEAYAAIHNSRARSLGVYQCKDCQKWHIFTKKKAERVYGKQNERNPKR